MRLGEAFVACIVACLSVFIMLFIPLEFVSLVKDKIKQSYLDGFEAGQKSAQRVIRIVQ